MTVFDAEGPRVGCSPQTIECTSPGGAKAVFTATATDNCDPNVAATCSPVSGSTFPLGSTTVSCSATDQAGNRGMCQTSVTVVDTTPPVASCVPSVNPSGANVPSASAKFNEDGFYQVSGSDACGTVTIKLGTYTLLNGETVKITQSPGFAGVTLLNLMGPGQIKHFQVGPADAVITAFDGSNYSLPVSCLVPPPPK